MQHGQGKLLDPRNAVKCEGIWTNDKFSSGTLVRSDKFAFVGEWSDNQFQKGKLLNPDGSVCFEGTWSNGKFAKGVGYLKVIKFYDGDWVLEKPHGFGIQFYDTGKIKYSGFWIQQLKHGEGKLYKQDGVTVVYSG